MGSLNKSQVRRQVRAAEAVPKNSAVGTIEKNESRETRGGRQSMDNVHLKKILAGFTLAGLLSGAAIIFTPHIAGAA